MSTSRSPRTPASPPDTLTACVLEALEATEARVSAVCWEGTIGLVLRVVWPDEGTGRLARSIAAGLERYDEPAFTLAVMPDYTAENGKPRQWSRATRFGETGTGTAFRLSERVERVLREMLAARPRPRRRWYSLEITS